MGLSGPVQEWQIRRRVVTFGSGEFAYEVVEGWGELPEGWQWGQIASVTVDAQDRVYLYTRTEHPVMIFDRDGHFIRAWGATC